MSEYRIITDSTTDLTPELAKQLGITVMGLYFHYNGTMYRDSLEHEDVSPKAFYDYLRKGGASSTSQVNVEDAMQTFRPVLEAGQDILCLGFSTGLSGTCQSYHTAAQELREEFPDRRIEILDTLQASMGEGLMVYYAAQLQKQGKTLDEVLDYLRTHGQEFCAWFTVDDLMFLKRGGRLSGGAAIAGTLLGIKPVLHVDSEGHLVNTEKVRGRKISIDALAKKFAEGATDKSVVMISHGDCLEDAQTLAAAVKKAGAKKVYIGTVGTVIGGHSGPGTLALFYVGKNR